MPDSMVFYSSFASAIKRLPPDEQLKALWSILDYGLDEKEPEEDGLKPMCMYLAYIRPENTEMVRLKARDLYFSVYSIWTTSCS